MTAAGCSCGTNAGPREQAGGRPAGLQGHERRRARRCPAVRARGEELRRPGILRGWIGCR